jgi:hypothetical protein
MDDPSDPSKPRIEVVNMNLAGGGFDDGNCGNSNSDPLPGCVRLENRHDGRGRGQRGCQRRITSRRITTRSSRSRWPIDGRRAAIQAAIRMCGAGGVNTGAQGGDKFAKFSDYGPDIGHPRPGGVHPLALPNSRYGRMTGRRWQRLRLRRRALLSD